jgi:hypothetical protein
MSQILPPSAAAALAMNAPTSVVTLDCHQIIHAASAPELRAFERLGRASHRGRPKGLLCWQALTAPETTAPYATATI